MGNLINRKRAKAFAILDELGTDVNEASFTALFKQRHPVDWTRITQKFEEEERSTPASRRHPMPDPRRYMADMYRNFSRRWKSERG